MKIMKFFLSLVFLPSIFLTASSTQGKEMYNVITKDEIKIVGLAKKTQMDSSAKDIPALWQKFFEENTVAKIPNKKSEDVMGLYCDYEGDHTKPYSLVIGCEVTSFDNVPEGLVCKTIPATKYAVFTAKGKLPESIMTTWQTIWNTKMERSFSGDFEFYDSKFDPSKDSEVDIFIAIK